MKTLKDIYFWGFMSCVPLSWLIAKWWSVSSGDPWCLHCFPGWIDKIIYQIARPLLSENIGTAAEQMDFIEVWISTFIMTTIVIVTIVAVVKKQLLEEPGLARFDEVA